MVYGNVPYKNHTMNSHAHGGMKYDELAGKFESITHHMPCAPAFEFLVIMFMTVVLVANKLSGGINKHRYIVW